MVISLRSPWDTEPAPLASPDVPEPAPPTGPNPRASAGRCARGWCRAAGLALPPSDGERARTLRSVTSPRRRVAPGSSPGGSMAPASRRTCSPWRWRRRRPSGGCRSPAAASWRGSSAPASRRTTPWRWPGSDAAWRARSICTRCCRCRTTFCASARPIRRRWPGWRPIGAPPIGCARSASDPQASAVACRLVTAIVGYGFFTAGETPHAAIAALAARWPGLHFVLRPMPAD